MPDLSDQQLQCMRPDGVGLQLRFRWVHDRFAHQISLVAGADVVPLLQSLEQSDADPAWPTSPPLQQLHLEDRPDGPAAMLVGMAGRSHWSMSVECRTATIRLKFDVACRLHQRPASPLGCRYQLLEDAEALPSQPSAVQCSARGHLLAVQLEPISLEGGAHWQRHADQLHLAIPVPEITLPATVRWQYSFILTSG